MKKIAFLSTIPFLLTVLIAMPAVGGDDEYGGGEISFSSPAKGVIFSHKLHVGELGLNCEACHDDLFAMEALAVQEKEDFTMASLEKGQYCGACHDGSTAFAVGNQCSSCHQNGGEIFFNEPVRSVLFSHQKHEESGLECSSCHSEIFAMKSLQAQGGGDFTMDALNHGKFCGTCHDGQMAFASNTRCADCHAGVKGSMKMGEGAQQNNSQSH